ncbi:hypothetical protein [Bradyrhizobium sp. Gha]|uniref:hypothetical protein n=1 Tax=Bradyrhizobium sp. Gha TaxID=1855318 RepID=UPI001160A1DE|nr:hypothetical protein [Bradyrhizobium sp. Gha]
MLLKPAMSSASERERQFAGTETVKPDAGCGSGAVVTVVIAEGRALRCRLPTGEIRAIGEQRPAFPIARWPAVAGLVADHPHFDDRRRIAMIERTSIFLKRAW